MAGVSTTNWRIFTAHSSGPAEDLLCSTQGITYAELTERLRQRYGTREQHEKFRLELKFRRKKSTESLQELAGAVEKLTRLAYPSADAATKSILRVTDSLTL